MVPLQKLEQIHQRYEFLEAQMSAGISGEEIAKLSKEYSKLKPDKFARQTLEKFYACKGIVMISKFDIFLDKKSFFSDRCYFFPIQNKLRMFDINYEEDLDLARIISKKYPTLLSE